MLIILFKELTWRVNELSCKNYLLVKTLICMYLVCLLLLICVYFVHLISEAIIGQ